MFNKIESNEFGNIDIKKTKVYPMNKKCLVTPSFVIMLNSYKEEKNSEEKMDYESKKIQYLKRLNECNTKNQYNKIIVNLYQSGKLSIDNEIYSLKDLFIVYDDDKKYQLLNINKKNDLNYNHAVKFIDTTAFIKLINDSDIINNTIIVKNDKLNSYISNWDGYLHNQVKETDAIINKKITGDDINE